MNIVVPLMAIWLNSPVVLGDGRKTVRITVDDLIRVENGEIKDCVRGHGDDATHEVRGVFGTLSGYATHLHALNLHTKQIETISNF